MNARAAFLSQIVEKLDEADWLEREAAKSHRVSQLCDNWHVAFHASQSKAYAAQAAALRTYTTGRLAFADWLEENGDPQHELIRVACEVVRLKAEVGNWSITVFNVGDSCECRTCTLRRRERELQAQLNPFAAIKVDWDRGLLVSVTACEHTRFDWAHSVWRDQPIRTIVLRDWHGIERSLPPKPLEALPWLRELKLPVRTYAEHGDVFRMLFGPHPQHKNEPRVRVTFHE